MAGDIQQLAPVTKSDNPLAKKSVYEDIISYLTDQTNETNQFYTRLNKQYRSHPQIYSITSDLFYGGDVVSNDDMHKLREYGPRNYGKLLANPKNHIEWCVYGQTQLDTSTANQSKCNKREAEIAVKYIKKFIIELKNKEQNLAVISDYRAQIEYTKKLLAAIPQINVNDILLCTTNEIEGSSKEVVIVMCVRSNNTGNIGFLNDSKRVNVALSRAEYTQIIIGDPNTLQYNPIYNKIFKYHKKEHAVVCENILWKPNINCNFIKPVKASIPLIPLIMSRSDTQQRNDFRICFGCGNIKLETLFCGRSCSIDLCEICMDTYLSQYCRTVKQFIHLGCPNIITKTIIDKSQLFAVDSSGISLEFDILLGKYLMRNGLIRHIREVELSKKLCDCVLKLCNDISTKYRKLIPPCFKLLIQKYCDTSVTLSEIETRGTETANALGIIRCKRNHLLQQDIMDTKFFHIINKIKYNQNNTELKKYYNWNGNKYRNGNKYKYKFYLHYELNKYQPTTVIVAYLQCCGYTTQISNRLRKRIAEGLFDLNKNHPGKSKKHLILRLNTQKIHKFARELESDQSRGIHNVLSNKNNNMNIKQCNVFKWSCYIVQLMQNAVIDDTLGPYYQKLTHKNAMSAELTFGDKLRMAGFGYIAENELKCMGFRETPDYYLKQPWIINYKGKKVEITWLDFKNNYCSATEWNIEKLNKQAIKYNKRFGMGAFVFSLGYVQPPKGLQLSCYGLLAAIPLEKKYVERFINKRINK